MVGVVPCNFDPSGCNFLLGPQILYLAVLILVPNHIKAGSPHSCLCLCTLSLLTLWQTCVWGGLSGLFQLIFDFVFGPTADPNLVAGASPPLRELGLGLGDRSPDPTPWVCKTRPGRSGAPCVECRFECHVMAEFSRCSGYTLSFGLPP